MKSRSHSRPILVAAGLVLVLAARGQGTFAGGNAAAGARTQFVTDCDGKPLSGTNYLVQVLVKNPATGKFEGGLERVRANDANTPIVPEPMHEGRLAGIFSFGTVKVPFLPGGKDAQVQLRVWDATGGKDFDGSAIRGETNLNVRLGGAGNPPTFPGRLSNFRGLVVCKPAK